MNLKEQMARDVQQTFMNPDEFAEIHSIYGVDLLCIINNDSLRQASQAMALDAYSSYLLLHISRTELEKIGRMPKEGNEFNLDGKRYRVTNVAEEMGMMEIALERAESL
ncbi:hypothetical protein NYE54_08105 [Paenibacillus sp. FSL K6-1330]|uniref:hypothetical protein n=1 Tax=Paenibacillus sp. FSL K6-1330 TaxID=2975292 RepID=UPI0030D9A0A5